MKTLNAQLEPDKGIRLAIRVGIHTGLTVVGDVGSGQKHELLALGEAPNVASRIQGLAEPNTIAISEATYRLVEGYFTVEDLGLHTLKGVAEPQQVYRVLQESGAHSRLEIAATRGLTPLVGRESEVTLLLDRWVQVQDGQGQVVLLSGEGGIGKSRLVQVLKEHVAGELHTLQECRCSPYHTQSAFFPLIDLLQRKLHWQSEDTPDEKLHKLETVLIQTHLDVEKAVPLFTPLLALPLPDDRYPTLSLSSQRQRQQTMEALVTIFLEAAAQHPVVLIVEDLHWIDPSTLEFLDLFIDQVPTAQILTLLTCRLTFQPPWSSRSYLTQMTLSRLSHNQIERMTEQVAGGKSLPAEVLQQIVEKTDGVPLFVEEMTKAVLESGVLKETDGHYKLVAPLTSLTIPATLQDSLMARLDRLMTAKVIAQLGATIGRHFSYELLQAVSQLDEATLQRELTRLVEAELLYQRGVPPQTTFTFKHALIRDAAYESLLRGTRQQYHQRIAQILEERFPEPVETQPELLAHHYTEAALNEQSVVYWHKAGQRAVQRSANVEAISHLRKGLEVLQTLPDAPERTEHELELLIALGAPLMVIHGYGSPEAEHVYAQARMLCQKVEGSPHLFPALWGYNRVCLQRAEYQVAREVGEQLLTLAERMQDSARLLEAHFALGAPLLWMGEIEAALLHMEAGRRLYDPQQHRSLMLRSGHDHEVGCLTYEARALWFLGYPDRALRRIYEALTRARELSHPFSQARALRFVVALHQYRRESQQAREKVEELLTIARTQDFALWVAIGTMMLGWTLAMQGQEEGIGQIHQGLNAVRAVGTELGQSYWLSMLAEAYAQVGRREEGLTVLNEALTFVEKTGERVHEAELHRLKGQLLLQLSPGNPAEAETCFHKALDIARHQQAKSWELRAAMSLARLWQSQDKRQEAYDLLAAVYGWFTEGFDTLDLKDAKSLLDELEDGR
jgi:predicted ATPase